MEEAQMKGKWMKRRQMGEQLQMKGKKMKGRQMVGKQIDEKILKKGGCEKGTKKADRRIGSGWKEERWKQENGNKID